MRKPRVLIFDIESTDLEAGFGTVMCVGYHWFREPGQPTVISNLDRPSLTPYLDNDSRVLKRFARVFAKADYVVAHFGGGFDIPFLQSRLIINGLPVLPPTMLKDSWKTCYKKLKFKSNSLRYVAKVLGVKTEKTDLDPLIWKKAARGHRPSMKYIVKHCLQDVKVLEAVWEKISPLESESLPAITHVCGDRYLRTKDYRVCAKKVFKRQFCLKCGGWFKGKATKI